MYLKVNFVEWAVSLEKAVHLRAYGVTSFQLQVTGGGWGEFSTGKKLVIQCSGLFF